MSKTTFFELNGSQYKVELVEAEKLLTQEQSDFLSDLPRYASEGFGDVSFNCTINNQNLSKAWEQYLISEARNRGFISGCTIKTATDMDKMKSGKMQLIGLSKLAVSGRKQIIIYDGGKWVAESIPEVKKHWFVNDTLSVGKQLSREEMSKVKCEPEKYNIEDLKNIICDVTFLLSQHKKYITITSNQAKLISEILNDYLK